MNEIENLFKPLAPRSNRQYPHEKELGIKVPYAATLEAAMTAFAKSWRRA